jgi:hypothetical protein
MTGTSDKPRRLMMIGYNTVDELIRDGKIRFDDPVSLELQFNLGRMFDEVVYVVPFGRETIERRIDETTIYRELAFDRSERGLKLVLNGLKHVGKARAFLDRIVETLKPDVVQTVGPHIPAAMAILSPHTRKLPIVCMIEAYWEDILPFQKYFPAVIKRILPYWYRIAYRIYPRYTGAPSLSPPYYTSKGMDAARISPWIQPLDLREVDGAHGGGHAGLIVVGLAGAEDAHRHALGEGEERAGGEVGEAVVARLEGGRGHDVEEHLGEHLAVLPRRHEADRLVHAGVDDVERAAREVDDDRVGEGGLAGAVVEGHVRGGRHVGGGGGAAAARGDGERATLCMVHHAVYSQYWCFLCSMGL